MPPIRITYLFRSGRRDRLVSPNAKPTEFMYGLPQLQRAGWNVGLLEDVDLAIASPLKIVPATVNMLARFFGGIPLGLLIPLVSSKNRLSLKNSGTIVATTNGFGLILGLAKALGLIKNQVLLIAMGLLPIGAGIWQRYLYRIVTRNLSIVTISRTEQRYLSKTLRRSVSYMPFGVDLDFWSPSHTAIATYVVAMGNDRHRDWETLINAWSLDLPPLKIITKLSVPAAPSNVEVIEGDWTAQTLTDERIRSILRGALFVVIPLKDTLQPAGQSVCLQAMACGKAVVLTDITGIWDSDLIVNGETVLLIPPGNVSALSACVHELSANSALIERLGAAGRKIVEQHLNTDRMAESLKAILEQLHVDQI
jgi:glycosyltransferase involved in cell wall biosynthesis